MPCLPACLPRSILYAILYGVVPHLGAFLASWHTSAHDPSPCVGVYMCWPAPAVVQTRPLLAAIHRLCGCGLLRISCDSCKGYHDMAPSIVWVWPCSVSVFWHLRWTAGRADLSCGYCALRGCTDSWSTQTPTKCFATTRTQHALRRQVRQAASKLMRSYSRCGVLVLILAQSACTFAVEVCATIVLVSNSYLLRSRNPWKRTLGKVGDALIMLLAHSCCCLLLDMRWLRLSTSRLCHWAAVHQTISSSMARCLS